MIYSDDRMDDVVIAYIGGGSRGWAWTLMTDLAREGALSGTVRLYDIDRAAAAANEIIGRRLSGRQDTVGKWDYCAVDTIGEALEGADFVIISILPGTFDDMETDVHMPERLGIYQPVGDTAGPGGMMRAMRAIPMFVEIAEAIRTYSPDAWVINYTNPMSLLVKTLYHVFPGIKAFGCCHEVFGTQKVLAGIMQEELAGIVQEEPAGIVKEEMTGVDADTRSGKDGCSISREDINVNVLGINHFTWFDSASYKGIDLFPVYRHYIEEHFEEGYNEPGRYWTESVFNCAHRVKMDLFRRYGLIAAAGDRHLAEFMPGEMYLKTPGTAALWKFRMTPVSWRKEDLKKRLERSGRLMRGEEVLEPGESGEEGVRLIKALCGLGRVISNVNIPNTGRQIGNLPESAVVETNAVFERNAVRPVLAGCLPEAVRELVMPHVRNHERVLRAALDMDKGLLFEAFLEDPLVRGRASAMEVRRLMEDMLEATLGAGAWM